MTKRTINRSKLFRRLVLAVLVLGTIALYLSNQYVKRYGFEGLKDFISTYRHNSSLADHVTPERMVIKLKDSDYQFLKDKRQEALDRGIQINIGDNYVPCEISFGEIETSGEMRLKGHMTDHLEGDKWSFRVKSDDPVMGMTRFTLQDPGTRNYAYEWVYHQLLKNEDVIHLNYDFIELQLNDKVLGIYAVEEHFGQHVPLRNQRPKGAILRWNPELYWEWRIDELQGTYLDEQYSAYSSSFPEPYDKGVVQKDSVLVATYQTGAALLEGFRRGEKSAAEVFDLQRMASFHAVIDLVGGHHSLDWSDVKFFYNSETEKIEPIGYESFSIRKTERLAGQRTPDDYSADGLNYHDQLFADPDFYAAYIQALERIANKEYFNSFMNEISAELDQKIGVLAHEFPYIKFSFDPYFENIDLIRHNLELPKPFHAFLQSHSDSLVTLSISPVSDFPIEILSLVIDDKETSFPDSVFFLPAKARNTFAHYFEISFTVKKFSDKMVLRARIPGSSFIFNVDVAELPDYRKSYKQVNLDTEVLENSLGEFIAQSERSTMDLLKTVENGTLTIAEPVAIDVEDTVIIPGGLKLRFTGNGSFYNYGTLMIIGGSGEEESISLTSESSQSIIQNKGGTVIIRNIEMAEGKNHLIQSTGGKILIEKAVLADFSGQVILANLSEVVLLNCQMGDVSQLGCFNDSFLKMKYVFASRGDLFIEANGSDIEMIESRISRFKQLTNLNHNSDFRAWSSSFKEVDQIARLNHASHFQTFISSFENCKVGFELDQNTQLPGSSTYELYKSGLEDIQKREMR